MIHTFYSNSFEGLEAALQTNVMYDIKQSAAANKNPLEIFNPVEIVVPNLFIADRINRGFASSFGVSPGLHFNSMALWLAPLVGRTLSRTSGASSLEWVVWSALSDPKLIEQIDKLDNKDSALRFKNYLAQLSEVEKLHFARNIAGVFYTYASYRIDWLMRWIDINDFFTKKEELLQFEQQPDYPWLRELWRFIALKKSPFKLAENANLYGWAQEISEKLHTVKNNPSSVLGTHNRNKTAHLFMPFAIPPLLLPFLKLFAGPNAPDLWLYILNPSMEYWFEAIPINQMNWEKTDTEITNSPAMRYLCSNLASTRAMIDRLFNFLNDDSGSIAEKDEFVAKEPTLGFNTSQRKIGRLENFVYPALTEHRDYEVENYFINFGTDSFLHRLQSSLTQLDNSILPLEPDPKDQSLKVLKASSFSREIEVIIDIIHYWLSGPNKEARIKGLTPSDILIAVPDIQTAAPLIEGVMNAMPTEMSIPWKILGNSANDANPIVQGVSGFVNLLTRRFDFKNLSEWLELQINQVRWELDLADLTYLKDFLLAAGFRIGINRAHLNSLGFEEDDGSLDQALERLSLGMLLADDQKRLFMDTYPVSSGKSIMWSNIADDAAKCLRVISALYEFFEKQRQLLNSLNWRNTPEGWKNIILSWLEELFVVNGYESELALFRTSLLDLVDILNNLYKSENDEPALKIPFSVFWDYLSSSISENENLYKPSGAITFAPLSLVRAAPFKVIAIAGLDETSGFPGTPKFEEYDLMQAIHRRADRDSRLDNKAVFLDTVLAARQRLLLSYTEGPMHTGNPSVVIEDLKNYFVSNARENMGQDAAETLWSSLVSRVPLNSFSTRNFQLGKYADANLAEPISQKEILLEENRFWLSPKKQVLEAIQDAAENLFGEELERFTNIGVPPESVPHIVGENSTWLIPTEALIKFYDKPEEWLEKGLGIYAPDTDEEDQDIPLRLPQDHLSLSIRTRNLAELIEKNGADETLKIESYNPQMGLACLREKELRPEVTAIEFALKQWRKTCDELGLVSVQDPVEIVYHSKPIAFDKNSIEGLWDQIGDFYVKPSDGSLAKFELCSSSSARIRTTLRNLIWIAAGKPYLLFTKQVDSAALTLENTVWDKDSAKKIVDALLQIFVDTLKHGTGYIVSYGWDDGGKAPPLWKGNPDYSAFCEVGNNIKKSLKNILTETDDLQKKELFLKAFLLNCEEYFELRGKL